MHRRCCNEYTGKKSVPHIQEAHAFTDGAGAFSGGLNSTVWLETILKSNVENVNEGEEAQEHINNARQNVEYCRYRQQNSKRRCIEW